MALEQRYKKACKDLSARGCETLRKDLEQALRDDAKIVLAMRFDHLVPLAANDRNIVTTFHQRVDAGVQIPEGNVWDQLRTTTEDRLFYNYKREIRFAALSLDGTGIKNFGECSCTLRLNMVEHRTTLYEENNVIFLAFRKKTGIKDDLPPGHRALWSKRTKLGVAKLAPYLDVGMSSSDFPTLVLTQAPDAKDASLIEAHIYGSVTIKGIERVTIRRRNNRPFMSQLRALKHDSAKHGVTLEWH
ncbi:MAG: hypothetical protein AB2730_20205 [Candidatus Thiodiazotropha sp.]